MSKPIIGLEIHIQLKTQSKLFCACPTASFGAPPNTNICPICTGHPGTLPVINKKAIERLMAAALAFKSSLNPRSQFARKNYFYPDLPKNYQISQYEQPMASGGEVEFYSGNEKKTCRLIRIHMEEDAGKLLHAIGSMDLSYSLVDFNRAGMPLAELVTEPELSNPQEASDFLVALKNALKFLDVSNCDMEKGEMRVDVNISMTKPDGSWGTRVEIKNLNSFKSARDALDYEITRQKKTLSSGGVILQETRLWNVKAGQTEPMRSKEESSDYRYFPDPDLYPLEISEEWIKAVRQKIPKLPHQKIDAYQNDLSLSLKESQAILFNEDAGIAELFEGVLRLIEETKSKVAPRIAANWILNALLGTLKSQGCTVESLGLTDKRFFNFLKLVTEENLPSNISKEIFSRLLADSLSEAQVLWQKSGLSVMENEAELTGVVRQVALENPKIADDYRSGKDQALQALIGAVMRKTKGQAQPQKLKELFQKELKNAS